MDFVCHADQHYRVDTNQKHFSRNEPNGNRRNYSFAILASSFVSRLEGKSAGSYTNRSVFFSIDIFDLAGRRFSRDHSFHLI